MHGASRRWALLAPVAAAAAALVVAHGRASATGEDPTSLRERCATRLSIALLGKSATPAQMTAADPQSAVDGMLQDGAFAERFARFVNATFNDDPGMTPDEDSAYWLTKYVLANGKPWSDVFVGPYDVSADAGGAVTVKDDPNGLGYFRSRAWLVRYAGNEATGLKLVTAYHILNNVLGLQLVASTNAPNADISVTGRQQAPCNGCHFDPWFALDHVASVLTRRVGTGDTMTFSPPTGGPQTILGGLTIADDGQLVHALVNDVAFKYRACELAFQYLYARKENACEGGVFDACVDAFGAKGTIQSAIAAVAKDPSFCQ